MHTIIVKLSYNHNSRIKLFNQAIQRVAKSQTNVRLYDAPTSKKLGYVNILDSLSPRYVELINRRSETLFGLNGKKVVLWEPGPYDPAIPEILARNNFDGKLYIIGPPGEEVVKFKNPDKEEFDAPLIDGNYISLEEVINEINKASFWK